MNEHYPELGSIDCDGAALIKVLESLRSIDESILLANLEVKRRRGKTRVAFMQLAVKLEVERDIFLATVLSSPAGDA